MRVGIELAHFMKSLEGDVGVLDSSAQGGWINAGFFICEPSVFEYLSSDKACVFEQEPLRNLCASGNLYAYKHYGFWQCMDTLRDKHRLVELWSSGSAPWALWQHTTTKD